VVSPDGLSGVRQLPRIDWEWSDNAEVGKGGDCLPYRQEISTEDFLKYMTGVLRVEFVRDDMSELTDCSLLQAVQAWSLQSLINRKSRL
jgi:hypothetical protein